MDKVTVGGNASLDNVEPVHNEQNQQEPQINAGAIRKSTTSSILNALGHASGQNFESVEAALSYIARMSGQQNNGGNVQPVEQPTNVKQNRITNNDLQEQFMKLQQDLQQKEQNLRMKELDNEILKQMGDRFDNDLIDYALQKIKSNIQWNNDGSYSIVNQKGQERYGLDGNPLNIQNLVQEIANGNPKLLKQKQSNMGSGSGLKPGGMFAGEMSDQIPSYEKDPAAFNAWAQRNGLGRQVGLKATTVTATANFTGQKLL